MNYHIATLSREERLELFNQVLGALSVAPSRSLCVIIPCIYWGITNPFDHNPETGKDWSHRDTSEWFPEIIPWLRQMEHLIIPQDIEEKRVAFVKQIIEDLKK